MAIDRSCPRNTAVMIVLVAALAACHHGPAPCPPGPSATAELPPADARLATWKAVAAGGALPAGATPASALPELLGYLGSPDPVRRDDVAYTLLARWIASELTDAELRGLRDQLLAKLSGPSVFERSFSILTLASIVKRDVAKPFLTDQERRALLAAAREFAGTETDLRGYTGATGWAHAAAHTADLLAQLAKEPLSDADRAIVLDAVAAFVTRRHGTILAYGEDGRLAVPIVLAARNGLPKARLEAFLKAIKAPLEEKPTETFDAGQFAAQRNARNLLFTLFVQASLVEQPTAGDAMLLDAVKAALTS